MATGTKGVSRPGRILLEPSEKDYELPSCTCLANPSCLEIFQGVFTEKYLRRECFPNPKKPFQWSCVECNPSDQNPQKKGKPRVGLKGGGPQADPIYPVESTQPSSGADEQSNCVSVLPSDAVTEGSSPSELHPSPFTSPKKAREPLMSAAEHVEGLDEDKPKPLFLCVTCCACLCPTHAVEHFEKENIEISSGKPVYPDHTFFIAIPAKINVDLKAGYPVLPWGLAYPTFSIPAAEKRLISRDFKVQLAGKARYATLNAFRNSPAKSETASLASRSADDPENPNKTPGVPALIPGKGINSKVLEMGPPDVAPSTSTNVFCGRWSFVVWCPCCHDLQSQRLTDKRVQTDGFLCQTEEAVHRLGNLTAFLLYCHYRGVRLVVPKSYFTYCTNQAKRGNEPAEAGSGKSLGRNFFSPNTTSPSTAASGTFKRGFDGPSLDGILDASPSNAGFLGSPMSPLLVSSPKPLNRTSSRNNMSNRNVQRCTMSQVTERGMGSPFTFDENPLLLQFFGMGGFKNPSMYCYMNAVLQCITHTNFFVDVFLPKKNDSSTSYGPLSERVAKLCQLQRRLTQEDVRDNHLYELATAIQTFFVETNVFFIDGEQQDAQEFFLAVMNALNEEREEMGRKGLTNRMVTERIAFEGMQRRKVSCTQCSSVKERFEKFMALSIPLESSIRESLVKQLARSKLRGQNRYSCENCFLKLSEEDRKAHNEKVEKILSERKANAQFSAPDPALGDSPEEAAENVPSSPSAAADTRLVAKDRIYSDADVFTDIVSMGPTLALHLLRFHYDRTLQEYIKVNSDVAIDRSLDLSPFVSDEVKKTHLRYESLNWMYYVVCCYEVECQGDTLVQNSLPSHPEGGDGLPKISPSSQGLLTNSEPKKKISSAVHQLTRRYTCKHPKQLFESAWRTADGDMSKALRNIEKSLGFSSGVLPSPPEGVNIFGEDGARAAKEAVQGVTLESVPRSSQTPTEKDGLADNSTLPHIGNSSRRGGDLVSRGAHIRSGAVSISDPTERSQTTANDPLPYVTAANSQNSGRGLRKRRDNGDENDNQALGLPSVLQPVDSSLQPSQLSLDRGAMPNKSKDTSGNSLSGRKVKNKESWLVELPRPLWPRLQRELVSMVTHRGSLDGGHYISFVRDLGFPDMWFRCDDEIVDVVSWQLVQDCSSEVYLAFYE